MPTFQQTFLKPGRYHVGGGEFRDISAAELAEYVAGTRGVIKAGYAPPVLLEHAPRGTREGEPVNRDEKAMQVRNGVGWVTDVTIGSDGAAVWDLEIGDPEIAKKLQNGSIKFTSPELRELWTDGNGFEHKKFFAHAALTHKPRAISQGPIEATGALQFGLADLEQGQKSRDAAWHSIRRRIDQLLDDPQPQPSAKGKSVMRKTATQFSTDIDLSDRKQLQAVIERLGQIGIIVLPDTTPQTFLRDILTAVKSYQSAREQLRAKKQRTKKRDGDDNGNDVTREDRGTIASNMQFSLGGRTRLTPAEAGRRQAQAFVAKTQAFREAGKLGTGGPLTPQQQWERAELERSILKRARGEQ